MPDATLEFERTLQLMVGDRAYQSAGEEGNATARRARLRELCKLLSRHITELDTTVRHRERLLAEIQYFDHCLKANDNPSREMLYVLLRLVGRLLGHDYYGGVRPHTPIYVQSEDQRFTTALSENDEGPELFAALKGNAMTLRRDIVRSLKEKGIDDFTIALVLNTSECQVKKLRRGL